MKKDVLSFRPITEEDVPFLYKVYANTRYDELSIAGWTEEQTEDFLQMQFNLQHRQYMENYKNAKFEIILLNNEQIGRLYVDRMKNDIRIIDIALLPEYRKKGLGSKIMNDLIEESKEKNIPLSLHVEHNNPAMGLYEKLGFAKIMEEGVYIFMRRVPS